MHCLLGGYDNETYANKGGDCRRRIELHEDWYNYIIEEVVPTIRHLSGERNGYDQMITAFGCSMGAMHAANFFFRRPDLFDQVFAISGIYDSKDAFGDYMDDLVYRNTPVEYLMNMPAGCPFAPRCDEAMKICLRERAERIRINGDHQAACWVNVREAMKEEGGADK